MYTWIRREQTVSMDTVEEEEQTDKYTVQMRKTSIQAQQLRCSAADKQNIQSTHSEKERQETMFFEPEERREISG